MEEPGAKYRYPLLAEPPEDFICPICHDLLATPMLTGCCGHHYCQQCVSDLRQKAESAADADAREIACPMCQCRGDGFTLVLDRRTDRMLRALRVECLNRRDGCPWRGVVGELEEHVRRRCELARWGCPRGCGALLLSSEVEPHVRSACPEALVPCPSPGCEAAPLPRGRLEAHLADCPMRPVGCRFASAGCDCAAPPTLPRKDLARHMESCAAAHLCMLLEAMEGLRAALAEKDARLTRLERALRERDREIAEVKKRLDDERRAFDVKLRQQSNAVDGSVCEAAELKDRVQTLEKCVPVPPYHFTLTNYSKHRRDGTGWLSPLFYASLGRYKMLVEVIANGSHISLYIRVVRGEYDDGLEWPLSAKVTVQLTSQAAEEQQYRGYRGYELTTPTYQWERVLDGAIGNGWGWDRFIAHDQLGEYLKNDRLNFSVICVDDEQD